MHERSASRKQRKCSFVEVEEWEREKRTERERGKREGRETEPREQECPSSARGAHQPRAHSPIFFSLTHLDPKRSKFIGVDPAEARRASGANRRERDGLETLPLVQLHEDVRVQREGSVEVKRVALGDRIHLQDVLVRVEVRVTAEAEEGPVTFRHRSEELVGKLELGGDWNWAVVRGVALLHSGLELLDAPDQRIRQLLRTFHRVDEREVRCLVRDPRARSPLRVILLQRDLFLCAEKVCEARMIPGGQTRWG